MKPLLLLALLMFACPGSRVMAATSSTDRLTLEQALEMADELQPEIAQAKAMVEAVEGRAAQAGAFPNPEAIVGAQQIPFGDNTPNVEEYVAGIAQTIPLSRRLSKARQAEMLDREVRARGLVVKRRDIHRRVHSAFATALYQEKACHAQTQILESNEQAVAITKARIEEGDALREDLARVEVELARAKVEVQNAESLHQQSLVVLASAIGDAGLSLKSLAGTLDATFEIPTLTALAANLPNQPETAQAEADIIARNARVDLAKAERVPDVRVELLYHRLEGIDQNTFDVGLSIPLPLFNRNEGRIHEARAEVGAAKARARMTQNELTERLRESYLKLAAALANSRTFDNIIFSRAETVLRTAEARYAAGDVSLAEILPIRRDWAAVQLSYLESLRDVMQAWVQVKLFAEKN